MLKIEILTPIFPTTFSPHFSLPTEIDTLTHSLTKVRIINGILTLKKTITQLTHILKNSNK